MSRKNRGWFEEKLVELKSDPEFLTEQLLIEVNEQLCGLMDEQGVSRAELAERLGCSRAHITQVLNGMPNLSLSSLVKLALALNADVSVVVGSQSSALVAAGPRHAPDGAWTRRMPRATRGATVSVSPPGQRGRTASPGLPVGSESAPEEECDAPALAA